MKTFKQFFEAEDNLHHLRVNDTPFTKSIPISDDDYRQIKHLLADKVIIDEAIQTIAAQSNLSEDHTAQLLQIILSQDDFETAITYLLNREKSGMTKEQLIADGNIFTAFSKIGYSENTVQRLYEFRFHAQPVMGKGELLLSMLIKGCKKADKGDIAIDNKVYDVKGVNARLRGQRGFSDGASATRVWADWFNTINQERNLNLKDTSYGEVPPAGGNEYNIKLKKAGYLLSTGSQLLVNYTISKEEFSSIIKQGLRAVYPLLSDVELTFVDDFVNNVAVKKVFSSGIYEQFLSSYLYSLLLYYLRIEDLEDTGIFAFGSSGQVRFFNKHTKNVFDLIKIDPPGFGSRSGPQGSAAGIVIKK